jgi:hypothetical protein
LSHTPSFQARFRAVQALLVLVLFGGLPLPGTRPANGGSATQPPPGSTGVIAATQDINAAHAQTGLQLPATEGTATLYATQRLTGVAALAPPAPNMYLIDVCVIGGATPGDFGLISAPPSVSRFPAPASGYSSTGVIGSEQPVHYAVNWFIGGTNVASSSTLFEGGLAAVLLTYSNSPGVGVSLAAYRGCSVFAALANTSATNETFTFDAQPAIPRAICPMISVSTGTATGITQGTVTMPVRGAYTQAVECQGPGGGPPAIWPVLSTDESDTLTLVFTVVSLGGATDATIGAVLFY